MRVWGPGDPVPVPKLVPGSSAAHPCSTRYSCLQLGAQRPPRGPPSCPPRGPALPGIPPVPHSRGGNKPGAGEWGELRVRGLWAGILPLGPPVPSTLDPPVSQAPKLSLLPQTILDPASKSPLLSHTYAGGTYVVHTHTVPHL